MQDPVSEQPSSINWKKSVEKDHASNLPESLQQLTAADGVRITQHIDPVEVVMCCFNRPCRYSVYTDNSEEQLLYVQEVSDCYARQIMGSGRGFTLKFTDSDMRDVLRLVRPQTCSRGSCGVCCTLPSLDVQSPPGVSIATVTERRTCCLPTYDIVTMDSQQMYSLNVVCFSCKSVCCCDTNLAICDVSGETVATLAKPGSFAECVGKSNNFTIHYKKSLPGMEKIAILGSMFLIDFHYFERQNRCCC